MTEQGLGATAKATHITMSHKRKEVVECHDHTCPEMTQHIEKVVEGC